MTNPRFSEISELPKWIVGVKDSYNNNPTNKIESILVLKIVSARSDSKGEKRFDAINLLLYLKSTIY